jgi:hypothetical protein
MATMDEMRETVKAENQPADEVTLTLTRDEIIFVVNLVDGVSAMRIASEPNIEALTKLRTKMSRAARQSRNDA